MTAFLDLVAFAGALPSGHKKLAGQIMALRDAQSARSDLDLAHDMVGSLEALWDVSVTDEDVLTENCLVALLYSAIILYARGTKTHSDHRKTFDIRAKLTPDEAKAHKVLCDLRDDAVAHFGPGGTYRGAAWQIDGVHLVENDTGYIVMAGSRRLVQSKELLQTLKAQVHRALMLADRNVQERNDRVTKSLGAALRADPALEQLLQTHGGDAVAFFGSKEAAAKALGGAMTGRLRGTSKH